METDIEKILTLVEQISEAPSVWIPFWGAVLAGVVSALASYLVFYFSRDERRMAALLQERKLALLEALEVVDLVYANSEFTGLPKPKGKEWDLQRARSAMNRMLVFCKDPEATTKAFNQAIGLHNPDAELPPDINMASVNEFRKQVARELGISEPRFLSTEKAWIARLPGAEDHHWP